MAFAACAAAPALTTSDRFRVVTNAQHQQRTGSQGDHEGPDNSATACGLDGAAERYCSGASPISRPATPSATRRPQQLPGQPDWWAASKPASKRAQLHWRRLLRQPGEPEKVAPAHEQLRRGRCPNSGNTAVRLAYAAAATQLSGQSANRIAAASSASLAKVSVMDLSYLRGGDPANLPIGDQRPHAFGYRRQTPAAGTADPAATVPSNLRVSSDFLGTTAGWGARRSTNATSTPWGKSEAPTSVDPA